MDMVSKLLPLLVEPEEEILHYNAVRQMRSPHPFYFHIILDRLPEWNRGGSRIDFDLVRYAIQHP